eukprot:TRINITY_DN2228_c0_g1_i2.p1 TRINITY_DN2228_c0_g1~~TRINITY_DN2228_c0_g1_i2.p1  ORF type:complete len:219 (-),score=60.15 TRINITY_DN2228_c0_g1_i2:93-659(-)
MEELEDYLKKNALPDSISGRVDVRSCTIYEVSAVGALTQFSELLQLYKIDPNEEVVFIHFGVHGKADCFNLEKQAFNEANFSCPDEQGWTPQSHPIHPRNPDITHILTTTLPLEDILEDVGKKYPAKISFDAGRFLCNYLYYQSLHVSQINGTKSVFIHVPPFQVIDQPTQLAFARELLITIASKILK